MHRSRLFKLLTALVGIAGLLPLAAGAHSNAHFKHRFKSLDTVYTMSNDPSGNSVLAFEQRRNGKLVASAEYSTGGLGTGGGLGNQSALATDGYFLFAVNAGSDDLSVFKIRRNGLELVDRIASGGVRPVSVTVDRDLVYVLNAGSDNIAGFVVNHDGTLSVLSGSEQPLSGSGVDPAQIQFSKDGRTLIVTEKATNQIVTFSLRAGLPVGTQVFPSAAPTPFGFALGKGGLVVVSEAAGGAANGSSASSYWLKRDGELLGLDTAVPTMQTAACWVAISPDGRFAYTTNTGSDTVSAYRVRRNGDLKLLDKNGIAGRVGEGGAPIDLTFSEQGEFLHVLNSGNQTITTFKVGWNGDLRRIGTLGGLPLGANGLVAF
jgi:6-phosphogluconolactonase (cycloisomerase 2 family)